MYLQSKTTYTLEVEESQELLQHLDVVWPRDEVPEQPFIDTRRVPQELGQAEGARLVWVAVDELILLQKGQAGLWLSVEPGRTGED